MLSMQSTYSSGFIFVYSLFVFWTELLKFPLRNPVLPQQAQLNWLCSKPPLPWATTFLLFWETQGPPNGKHGLPHVQLFPPARETELSWQYLKWEYSFLLKREHYTLWLYNCCIEPWIDLNMQQILTTTFTPLVLHIVKKKRGNYITTDLH